MNKIIKFLGSKGIPTTVFPKAYNGSIITDNKETFQIDLVKLLEEFEQLNQSTWKIFGIDKETEERDIVAVILSPLAGMNTFIMYDYNRADCPGLDGDLFYVLPKK